MTAYGYIRVSTGKQDYASQKHVLASRFAIDEFVEDTGTGRATQLNLQKLLDKCAPGDSICVCAIDRLSRSTRNLDSIAEMLRSKQVTLMSARESGVDLLSPAGKLIFQIAGSMAESEAQISADRVRAGLSAAKERGVKLGRRPMTATPGFTSKVEEMRALRAEGTSIRQIAETMSVSYGAAYKHTADVVIKREDAQEGKRGLTDIICRLSAEGLSPYDIQTRFLEEEGVNVPFPKIEAALKTVREVVKTAKTSADSEITYGKATRRPPLKITKNSRQASKTLGIATNPPNNLKIRIKYLLAQKKNVYEILDFIEAEFGVEYSIADLEEKCRELSIQME